MKQGIITVIVVIAIVAGAIIFSGNKDTVQGQASNHTFGNEKGIVTLVEYGDFECTACAAYYPILKQVKEDLKDNLKFQFIHFPLVQIHANTTAAHRAAEAASNQGKFWEMHNLLYERRDSWASSGGTSNSGVPISTNNPTPIFEQYAQELGVNMDQYKTEANSSETLAIINTDTTKGKEHGVDSTPTFFLDGVKIDDANTLTTADAFEKRIQEAIDAKLAESQNSQSKAADTTTPN